MYGLPSNFNTSVFVKKKLNLVCFSVNTINLTFDDNLSITIMGSFIHKHNQNETENIQTLPVTSSDLMSLIDKEILTAEGQKNGTLTIQFDNGHSLIILDDSKQYESYIINVGGKSIVV